MCVSSIFHVDFGAKRLFFNEKKSFSFVRARFEACDRFADKSRQDKRTNERTNEQQKIR